MLRFLVSRQQQLATQLFRRDAPRLCCSLLTASHWLPSPTTTSSSSFSSFSSSSGLSGLAGVGGWKAPPSPTQLEKVVKLETFAGQTSEYIGQTWLKFHEDETKGRVGWTLTRSQYKQLKRNANECPLFIIPLEKPEGYVTLVVQWQSQLALFTTLDEFRASASNADSHLTLTHYTELAAKKGLVLVRGDTSTPKLINAFEARMLVKRLYDYYLDPQKYSRWVKTFNHASKQFDYNSYIKELGFLA